MARKGYEPAMSRLLYSQSPHGRDSVDIELQPDLGSEEIKKIVRGWYFLVGVISFWAICVLCSLALLIMVLYSGEHSFELYLVGLTGLVPFSIAVYGTCMRRRWGLYIGRALCVVSLLAPPIGTLIGVIGLIGYSLSRPLFSDNSLDLKTMRYQLRVTK